MSNAALYGVDNRAVVEIEELTRQIGADRILDRCGNALTTQSVGPKILWLQNNRPEHFEKAAKIIAKSSIAEMMPPCTTPLPWVKASGG